MITIGAVGAGAVAGYQDGAIVAKQVLRILAATAADGAAPTAIPMYDGEHDATRCLVDHTLPFGASRLIRAAHPLPLLDDFEAEFTPSDASLELTGVEMRA